MNPIIEVKNLSRSFKQYQKEPGLLDSLKGFVSRKEFEIKAVNDLSFSLNEGEIVGFIGPNGAGKTTTLKMLSGLLYPTSGSVSVLGHEPFKREKEFLKSYALVMGQKSQLWWDLPPLEGFLLNKEIYEITSSDYENNVKELAGVLDIEKVLKIPVRKLSLGQRMKCELIAALLHKPRILFLDEPTIGLDVVVQKNIRAFLKSYNQTHKNTIILTSHYMDDVSELCHRIIIINHGGLIYDGSLKDLTQKYAQKKNLKLVFYEKIPKTELKKYGQITDYKAGGLSVTISVKRSDHTQIAAGILSKFPVDDLDISEIGLEEIIRGIFISAKA
ncbi:ABC transporter [Candidatus Collierbacteria bacterium RIFCSPHIGHO2_02_FULL_49_10]|uniref:ABC transporter n=2 Tax=Candidatus Collieribacteriota TaxID=1752725 RepID=A0A1F5EWC9_9BACT|nr:MAG: ABC transporter [Candidatus Collierbacteria bacterium RIFCSPHIGHO2_02_FULL_49_10]OGD72476.1 MAG: ABC transporter [Candidatus Collierbacteria bacterium RIFCSPHIGHO2_01_FULL_50_25]